MKLFYCVLFATICLITQSCNDNNKTIDKIQSIKYNWTEDQKRKYFQDSVYILNPNFGGESGDSINVFEVFARNMFADIKSKNIYNPYIYALEEPYIDSTKIDSGKFWFRIVVEPTFSQPYCLVVEKKANRTYLTAKMTDGKAGYYTGQLEFVCTKTFGDTMYNYISKVLHKLNFWKLRTDPIRHHGADGDNYTLEAIENGKYNIVRSWSPLYCGDRETFQLAMLGLDLLKISKLNQHIALSRKEQ
jgi:hypothetical protein